MAQRLPQKNWVGKFKCPIHGPVDLEQIRYSKTKDRTVKDRKTGKDKVLPGQLYVKGVCNKNPNKPHEIASFIKNEYQRQALGSGIRQRRKTRY